MSDRHHSSKLLRVVRDVVGVVVLVGALNRERRGSVRSRREHRSTGGSALKWAGLSAALAMGWTTVAAVIVLAIALCWVVADADRPKRLALLLTAWRHGTPAPHHHTRKPRTRGRPDDRGHPHKGSTELPNWPCGV